MGKKGKKKSDGSGDQKPPIAKEGVEGAQQGPSGRGPGQPATTGAPEPAPPPVVTQPEEKPQQPQQGQGKKKKGKQQQQQQVPEVAKPQVEAGTQPADVQTPQPGQGKAKQQEAQPPQQQQQARGPPPQQQQQQARGPPPQQQQQQARGPPPGLQQQQQWGPRPQQQAPPQQAWGGQQQQPQGAWGAPRGPPPQQQPPQQPWGAPRGQGPPTRGRGGPRGQTPPPQQQQGFGRGQPPPQQPQQQWRAQSPPQQQPQQQQQGMGRGQQQQRGRGGGRGGGGGRGEPPQQLQQQPQQQQQGMGKGQQQQPAQPPPPTSQLEQLKLGAGEGLELAKRKGLRTGGTQGRPLKVLTNHLELRIQPRSDTAYHYDVTITPDRPKRMMRPVWELFRQQYLPGVPVAFDDRKNAYSPTRFPDVAGEVAAAEDGRPKPYAVTVKAAAEVNLGALFSYMQSGCKLPIPQDALQCIDIVLRNASALTFVRVGRSFFSEPREERVVRLGDGLELWHGFFQSAVIGWKPFLNVDVAHKGFPMDQQVVDLFQELSDQGRYRDAQLDVDKANRFLKSLKVEYTMPRQAAKKVYRVNQLVDVPHKATFVHEERSMTVFDYFKHVKGYTIQQPQWPCLWVGARDRKVYLPPELCKVVRGQVCNRKLNELQTANMVRNAATSTDVRKAKTMDMVRRVNLNGDPVVRAFGIEVGADFEAVGARLLQPPALEYGRQQRVSPVKGTWRASEFLQPQELPEGRWTIIALDRRTRDDDLSMFARTIAQEGGKLGMRVGRPVQPFERMDRFDARRFGDILRKYQACAIVFVIVSDYPAFVYSKVKQEAELHVGLLTQCIKSRTMGRMSPATATNIMLKVNAKLNGKNHKIADVSRPPCLARPCMIMGADVTHPSPDQSDIPSVAAVTASFDATAFRYNFCWRLQPARHEIIVDLENIVREQLAAFYKTCRVWPERIIFFRDGVSEGQFREVMNMEVQAIKRACSKMGTPDTFKPPITFVVVQKRHHTRFFPTNPSESDDKNRNVRAGTVVDTYITHPTALEYYLVSHASIQGVARPTKYRVLYDEKDMSEDELEALTYYLCHMFSRCTRSVSYPAPTYYAHLAAFRARHYLEGDRVNLDNLAHEQRLRDIKPRVLETPMFFV